MMKSYNNNDTKDITNRAQRNLKAMKQRVPAETQRMVKANFTERELSEVAHWIMDGLI